MHICIHAAIAIIKCQGHTYTMEETETTVIKVDAQPDQAAQYKARNDPKVAAILKSLGINKEEDYIYQGNKRIDKLVSYILPTTDEADGAETKRLIKKIAEVPTRISR